MHHLGRDGGGVVGGDGHDFGLAPVGLPYQELAFALQHGCSGLSILTPPPPTICPFRHPFCPQRVAECDDLLATFTFAIPKARAPPPLCWCSRPSAAMAAAAARRRQGTLRSLLPALTPLQTALVRRQARLPIISHYWI